MCFIVTGCKYVAQMYPKQFALVVHPCAVGLILAGTVFFTSVEMFYVVPLIVGTEGLLYKIAWLVTIFIVFNLLGNMLACYRTDSSVENLPIDRQVPTPEEEHLWHHCDYCQVLRPPRSWHCKLCKSCILRRDHHCIFTATCIGHNNYRYFFWFLVYMMIGTFLSLATHLILFIINEDMRKNYFLFYLVRLDFTYLQKIYEFGFQFNCINLILVLNVYSFIFPLIMLGYQIRTIYLNTTFYTATSDLKYNQGPRKNFKTLMGKRGLWTFFSPVIRSPLLHDGTQWETKYLDINNC